MTDTATEKVDEDEVTPFLEDDREIAYRSEATPQVSASKPRSLVRGSPPSGICHRAAPGIAGGAASRHRSIR